jgi:hypothetical protein
MYGSEPTAEDAYQMIDTWTYLLRYGIVPIWINLAGIKRNDNSQMCVPDKRCQLVAMVGPLKGCRNTTARNKWREKSVQVDP